MVALDPLEFVWAVQSMAQIHRVPFTSEALLRACAPPYAREQLPQVMTAWGMTVRERPRIRRLESLQLPCLLFQDDAPRPILLVRVEEGQAYFFTVAAAEVQTAPTACLMDRISGPALECSRTPTQPPDPEGSLQPATRFGWRWFVPQVLRHRAIWRDVLVASLVIQLIALATPLFTQVIIDKVVVHHTSSTLAVMAVGLFVFIVFSAALTWVRQYLVLHTGNRVDARLGVTVLSHLLHLPLRYFADRPTGVIAARLQAVETLREFVASSLVTLLLDLPFLFVFVAIMFWYSVPLTLGVLGVVLLIAGLSVLVAPVFRDRMNRQFLLGARNQAFLTEHIAAMETVKSLQMEPQLSRRWGEHLADYLEAGLHTRQIANTYNVVAGALEQLMTLGVLTAGAWIVMQSPESMQGRFTIGMLVAFQMFAGRLTQPLMRLVGLWQQFQQARIAMQRLGDILDAPTEPYDVVPARDSQGPGRVVVSDLAFRYAPDRPFLYQSLHLTLEPGTTTVLVGPSGSGKSTLAKLLLGFELPTQGDICIDGCDLRHLTANELRAFFGVVPQETVLFSGSIQDNLLAANPHASFEMLVHACRMAGIHSTIEALPGGYRTEIGERGAGLSGGQKQRLAIARALLKRPRILIFDEATSALDPQTAEQFAQTVNALRGKVSMLFITHQLPRGLQVDRTIRLGGPARMSAAQKDEHAPVDASA